MTDARIARVERDLRALQRILNRGTWPEGKPLSPSDVMVVRHHAREKARALAHLRRIAAELEAGGGYEPGPG